MPPQIENQVELRNDISQSVNISPLIPSTDTSFLRKPNKNDSFIFTITFLLILTGIFGVWYFSNPLSDDDVEVTKEINTLNHYSIKLNDENLWEKKYLTKNETEKQDGDYYFLRMTLLDPDYKNQKHFPLSGYLWQIATSVKNQKEESNFFQKYRFPVDNECHDYTSLNEKVFQINNRSIRIIAPGLDGGASTVVSCTMSDDFNIRFLVSIYNMGFSLEENTYPRKVLVNIFVSDPVSIDDLSSKLISTSTPKIENGLDLSSLGLSVPSNVKLLLVDPSGKKTGYDPIIAPEVLQNIPNSAYFTDCLDNDQTGEMGPCSTFLSISEPMEGKYNLSIIGKGEYELMIDALNKDRSKRLNFKLKGVSVEGIIERFVIDFVKSSTGSTTINKI